MANDQLKNEIDAWLNASKIAIAAESHLQRLALNDPAAIRAPLLLGNTPPAWAGTQFESFVRFAGDNSINGPAPQLDDFLSRYDIIDHHANDSTGFSATLLQVKAGQPDAGRYVLAFRSTEYKNPIPGQLGRTVGVRLPIVSRVPSTTRRMRSLARQSILRRCHASPCAPATVR